MVFQCLSAVWRASELFNRVSVTQAVPYHPNIARTVVLHVPQDNAPHHSSALERGHNRYASLRHRPSVQGGKGDSEEECHFLFRFDTTE